MPHPIIWYILLLRCFLFDIWACLVSANILHCTQFSQLIRLEKCARSPFHTFCNKSNNRHRENKFCTNLLSYIVQEHRTKCTVWICNCFGSAMNSHFLAAIRESWCMNTGEAFIIFDTAIKLFFTKTSKLSKHCGGVSNNVVTSCNPNPPPFENFKISTVI